MKESPNADDEEHAAYFLCYVVRRLSFALTLSFAQTHESMVTYTPVSPLNTSGHDVPFGVDSSYVYLKREGVHLRSPRVANPATSRTTRKGVDRRSTR